MRRSRFSEEQIAQIVGEYRAGVTQTELARRQGLSAKTISTWCRKYSNMQASDVRKVKQLEDKIAKLERIVAQQAVELIACKDVMSKNW
ncbi:MAG: transposase [Bdellovibrionota bacterium]